VPLGELTVESQADSSPSGQAEAFPATAGATATITSLNVYIDSSVSATHLVVGLYASSGSHPGTLLAQGSTAITPGAWNTVSIPAVNLTTGTTYWFSVLGTQGGVLAFRDNAAGTCLSESSAQTTLTALPASWTSGAVWTGSCPLSAYGQ
jgi:hypothetical protein